MGEAALSALLHFPLRFFFSFFLPFAFAFRAACSTAGSSGGRLLQVRPWGALGAPPSPLVWDMGDRGHQGGHNPMGKGHFPAGGARAGAGGTG